MQRLLELLGNDTATAVDVRQQREYRQGQGGVVSDLRLMSILHFRNQFSLGYLLFPPRRLLRYDIIQRILFKTLSSHL